MTTLWDRRQPRIQYRVPVGVVDLDRQRTFSATSVNVSEGGIFVDSEELLDIGSDLVCNIPIDRDEHAVEVRGRVAWLRPEWLSDQVRPRGMGIEFVDLTENAAERLRNVIGPVDDKSHSVVLRVDGHDSPIHARAVLTSEGIFLRSPLPFLRLRSSVQFSFTEDDVDSSYGGRIHSVSVHVGSDRVPKLQVEVELTSLGHQEIVPPEPGPRAEPEAEAEEAGYYELLSVEAPAMEERAGRGAFDEATVKMAFPNPRARRARALWVALSVLVAVVMVAGLWWSASRSVPGESGAASTGPARSAPAAAETLSPEETSAARGEEDDEFVATAASARAARAAAALQGSGGVEPAREAPAGKDELEPDGAAGPAIVERVGDETVVRVPFSGSADGAKDYELADPDAVAINLPAAAPVRLGDRWIRRHGVRLIWVRERLGGLHVRVFFIGSAPDYRVDIEDGEVVVSFRR